MADLRIFSYLPNPRLFKATIAARYSGAGIEIVGAKPMELPGWLWDYDARELSEADRAEYEDCARQARTGFTGKLYKTDAFLAANPFGDVPAAFGNGGAIGLFESNSIMRAAARSGPRAGALCGDGPMMASRIDGFLDRSLVFARDMQRYILSGSEIPADRHAEMAAALDSYLGGIEQALAGSTFVASDELSLADVAFACELCLFSVEKSMGDALARADLEPLLPRLGNHARAHRHLDRLLAEPFFAKDLAPYREKLFS